MDIITHSKVYSDILFWYRYTLYTYSDG